MKAFINLIITLCGVLVSARKFTRRVTLTSEEHNAPCKTTTFFKILDTNGDGKVSNDEWTTFFSNIYKAMDKQEIFSGVHDELVAEFDQDKSGSVDAKEWNAFFAKSFKEMDMNTDNAVVQEEFDKWGDMNEKKNRSKKLAIKSLSCGFCTKDSFFKEISKSKDAITEKQWNDYFNGIFELLEKQGQPPDGTINSKILRSDFLMKKIAGTKKKITKDEWTSWFNGQFKKATPDKTLTGAQFRSWGRDKNSVEKFGIRAYVCAASRGDL